jgi:adenine specific DNA methylase Mod
VKKETWFSRYILVVSEKRDLVLDVHLGCNSTLVIPFVLADRDIKITSHQLKTGIEKNFF